MKRFTACLLAFAVAFTVLTGCQPQIESPVPTAALSTAPTVESEIGFPVETVPRETYPAACDITISEAMADNAYLTLGHGLDWVELHNREEIPVSLDGYFLTDDPQSEKLLSLSGLEVPAGGYLVVTLEENAPFHLSANGDTVALVCGAEVISQLTLGVSLNGESFDQAGACAWATPGYANTEEGYLSYLDAVELPKLVISEAMSSNSQYAHQRWVYYDWVEVLNSSDEPVNLLGYSLSDQRSEPRRYSFPDVTLQPGETYLVYCSADTSLGVNHAPFKLSSSGEKVWLALEGVLTDVLDIPADLQRNQSYGRSGNLPMYMDKPTPGAGNSSGYRISVEAPQADVPSGIYEEPVTLTLSGEGTVYYTTDGSRPTTRSQVYSQPLTVSGVTTIRAFCVSNGHSSPVTAYTYAVGVEHDLPVVSIAIPQSSLTGSTGVLNHIYNDYEHEAVLTLIEDGEEKFSVPFGFRLHGNDSRKGSKQNFQLRFRSEYGAGKLCYPLFDDREIDEYNSLLLKGGSEDWYHSMMRDELSTAIAHGTTSLYTQSMKPVVLYLGGKYWGVYYFRERFSDDYVASHLNVSQESVDILFSSAAYVQCGSGTDFWDLRSYVQTRNMTKPEHYAYLTERIDIQSMMDWYICRSYVGDTDTANVRRFRSDEYDGKWRWMYFDLDWGFSYSGAPALSGIADVFGGDMVLFQAAMRNPEFRDAFLKRYAELMSTVLNEEYINSVIDEIVGAVESEMPRDRERWGASLSHWESEVQELRDFVKDGARDKKVLQDLQTYFSLSNAEMEYYFGDIQ